MSPPLSAIADALVAALPAGLVLTDADSTGAYAHDEGEWAPTPRRWRGAPGDHQADAGRGTAWAAVDAWKNTGLYAGPALVYPALERLGPVLTEDICVPMTAVAQILGRIAELGTAHDVLITTIAHAGDGNLHPLIIIESGTTLRWCGRAGRSPRSSTARSPSAARSPVSTGSDC